MSSLKKKAYAKMATVESYGFVKGVSCRCDHEYCSCGSNPSEYVASDKIHYWTDEGPSINL